MKTQVLALCLAFPMAAAAQQLSPREQNIVRAQVKQVNAQTIKARRAEADILDESSEGGRLTVFRHGKSLLKMNVRSYGEMGRSTREIWFRAAQPVFIFELTEHYDQPLSGRIIRREEKRFYLQKGRLAALKVGTRWQKLSPRDRLSQEKEIREAIARYSKLAK